MLAYRLPLGLARTVDVLVMATLSYGWQYDSGLWALMPDDLCHSSDWCSVSFSENEAVLVPDGKSGIYCVCTSPVGRRRRRESRHDLFSILFSPIYIGKTDNLRRRFIEHCRKPSARLDAARRCFGGAMQFWFHRRDHDRIGGDEAILIRCFGPPANDRRESIMGVVGAPVAIGIHDQQEQTNTRGQL